MYTELPDDLNDLDPNTDRDTLIDLLYGVKIRFVNIHPALPDFEEGVIADVEVYDGKIELTIMTKTPPVFRHQVGTGRVCEVLALPNAARVG